MTRNSASFDFGSTRNRTRLLVNFTQAYYTIDVDSKASPKDFFDASVTVDDLRVGQPMELVVDTLFTEGDTEHLIWKWKPVTEGGAA